MEGYRHWEDREKRYTGGLEYPPLVHTINIKFFFIWTEASRETCLFFLCYSDFDFCTDNGHQIQKLTRGVSPLADMSHYGQLANVLSWIIPGISWRLGNRPQSASVASVSPVSSSDGTWTRRMRLTPPKPLNPPESEQVSPCKGSCTTGEVPQRGSRVRRCPISSSSYCSLDRVCTAYRTYTIHRLTNTCVCKTSVPWWRDTAWHYHLPLLNLSPACYLLLWDSHPSSWRESVMTARRSFFRGAIANISAFSPMLRVAMPNTIIIFKLNALLIRQFWTWLNSLRHEDNTNTFT